MAAGDGIPTIAPTRMRRLLASGRHLFMNPMPVIRLRMANLLDNPYHFAGALVARMITIFASAVWATVILLQENALQRWPITLVIHSDFRENALATIVLLVAFWSAVRIIRKDPPSKYGVWLYGALMLVWVYTLVTLCIVIYIGQIPMTPGQFAAVTTITMAAIASFVANPK